MLELPLALTARSSVNRVASDCFIYALEIGLLKVLCRNL